MTNAEVLDKAIRYLRLRCGAAYRAKDDDLLLKIVPVLCKAVEMQQKLSGAEDAALWKKADAHYHRSAQGGGAWERMRDFPEQWTIRYRDLTFRVRPTGFKHTGLFPEQAVNWDWMRGLIAGAGRPVRVLNLFA